MAGAVHVFFGCLLFLGLLWGVRQVLTKRWQ